MMALVGLSISCMPGPAARAFVADDHHIAGLDLPGQDAVHGFFLRFEDARRAGEMCASRR